MLEAMRASRGGRLLERLPQDLSTCLQPLFVQEAMPGCVGPAKRTIQRPACRGCDAVLPSNLEDGSKPDLQVAARKRSRKLYQEVRDGRIPMPAHCSTMFSCTSRYH